MKQRRQLKDDFERSKKLGLEYTEDQYKWGWAVGTLLFPLFSEVFNNIHDIYHIPSYALLPDFILLC